MNTLIKSPELRIQSGEDGVWLHFTTSKGDAASLNLHMQRHESTVIQHALTEWAREFAASTAAAQPTDADKLKRAVELLIQNTGVIRDTHMGFPPGECAPHPVVAIKHAAEFLEEIGEMDDDLRETWKL